MRRSIRAILGGAAVAWLGVQGALAEDNLIDRAPWTGGLGLGRVQYEGDEEVRDGNFIALRLGYDWNVRWTTEFDLNYAPSLPKRHFTDGRYEIPDDTHSLRGSLDMLFHLREVTDTMQWDPFLAAGVGFVAYGEKMGENDGKSDLVASVGGGVFYHINDPWAVRADYRVVVAGADTEFNQYISVGLNYRFGATVPESLTVSGGDIDSDGDGLLDREEPTYGTNPYDPDTDKDDLTDGREVLEVKTNPLQPDTDLDGLLDGPEYLTYKTNPLDRDTDKGGVADGHEVIEDQTNPLDKADDLILFTLLIEFDYDKDILRPIYFDKLDVVAKVLQRDPGATARVEGHADKRKTSQREYNINLSERRAKAVLDYLARNGIERSRLTAKGFGFDRPVAPNDTETNMQRNRRTEIYIRPSGDVPREHLGTGGTL